jgi:ankyrin repeat protein
MADLYHSIEVMDKAGHGYVDEIRDLLQRGADVNIRDIERSTPLINACTQRMVMQQLSGSC